MSNLIQRKSESLQLKLSNNKNRNNQQKKLMKKKQKKLLKNKSKTITQAQKLTKRKRKKRRYNIRLSKNLEMSQKILRKSLNTRHNIIFLNKIFPNLLKNPKKYLLDMNLKKLLKDFSHNRRISFKH